MKKHKLTNFQENLKEKQFPAKENVVSRYKATESDLRTIYMTMQLIILVVCWLPLYPYISNSL